MGHVEDRWTRPGPSGRERTDRWGRGRRWQAVWVEPGGQRRKQAFTSKDAARAHLARTVAAIEAGDYQAASEMTVGEFGDQWVKQQIHHRPATTEQLESRWRLHIEPHLGDRRLQDLRRQDVQDAVVKWSQSLAPSTVAVVYGYLASLLKAAAADQLIRLTPATGIRLPRVDKERVVPLTVHQVHKIAETVQPRYRAMVLLVAATGMRSGEFRGLTVDRLRFLSDGRLRVRVDRQLRDSNPSWGPPKTPRSDRSITVDQETARMVREHIARHPPHPSGVVFTGRTRRPMSRGVMSKMWHTATEGMVLRPRSGWHDLRHFHASMLIAAGMSVTAVADRLGHEDPAETLRTYAHLWIDDEDRAVAAVAAALWSTPGAGNPPTAPVLTAMAGGSDGAVDRAQEGTAQVARASAEPPIGRLAPV